MVIIGVIYVLVEADPPAVNMLSEDLEGMFMLIHSKNHTNYFPCSQTFLRLTLFNSLINNRQLGTCRYPIGIALAFHIMSMTPQESA